jgi:hypothetical protein
LPPFRARAEEGGCDVTEDTMGDPTRPAPEHATKEPAEGSRQTVEEALKREERKTRQPPEKPQTDMPRGEHAVDD